MLSLWVGGEEHFHLVWIFIIDICKLRTSFQQAVAHCIDMAMIKSDYGKGRLTCLYHPLSLFCQAGGMVHSIHFLHRIYSMKNRFSVPAEAYAA